jgi:hypothetical protein
MEESQKRRVNRDVFHVLAERLNAFYAFLKTHYGNQPEVDLERAERNAARDRAHQ